jgi:hypothetical protein
MLPITASPEYRKELVGMMQTSSDAFVEACRAASDPFKPLEEGGWNTHQIAAHVRDTDAQVYGMRIRRSASEQNPLFPNFDGDAWMAEHYNREEPLEAILGEFSSSIASLTNLLGSLKDEDWSRPSRHETQGDFVLQTWVERAVKHIKEHLETVRNAGSSQSRPAAA